ncbi:MAG: aldehyde ferredoxin oxidoreductase, partial [Dehalococcoidia bacterium]
MGIKSGYFKIQLHIDLSQGSIEQRALSDAFLEKYIGGRGFGAKFVWDNLKKHNFKIDPLGPENLLVVAPGPLTGAYLPSSGKNSFVAISPATGLYGDSSIGGSFGVELRQAGVDVLSIEGKAPELSVIFIDNGETSIVSMPNLKGKSCLEAERMIKERLGIDDIHVAIIGLAGENMVKFACVNTDWGRNAGRTGIGAIMGSKNLKAVAVRGDKDLPVHDIKGLVAENDKASEYMRNHRDFRMWQQQGL